MRYLAMFSCFFFNDTATTEIYTLSLHDALPICSRSERRVASSVAWAALRVSMKSIFDEKLPFGRACYHDPRKIIHAEDRKSTRLNSSHANISYAVFCLKKKNTNTERNRST